MLIYQYPTKDTWETMNVEYLSMLREIYMMAILNLKMSHGQYPPPTGNPQNIDLKTGALILTKIQAPESPFDMKYKPNYCIVER